MKDRELYFAMACGICAVIEFLDAVLPSPTGFPVVSPMSNAWFFVI